MAVFTFLFIAKQVKLISVFLYGSSFLAFAAATLDLGQILARGPENTTQDISLGNIVALLFAREIFLALSLSFLNLFFWMLVAECPREECLSASTDSVSTTSQQSMHSASWSRWGFIGTILKWGSLVALLSAPLVQALWRLIPSQRRYSTLYVAESTVQTSICLIFILKLFLNIYLSTLPTWWDAFRPRIPSFLALALGTSLGVGNLILFSFSESSLGRFLRAVEVYILVIYNLHATFFSGHRQWIHASLRPQSPIDVFPLEKSPGLLPIAVRSSRNIQMPNRMENDALPKQSPQHKSLHRITFPESKLQPTFGMANLTLNNMPINQETFSAATASRAPSSTIAISSEAFQNRGARSSPSLDQSSIIDMTYYSEPMPGNAQLMTGLIDGKRSSAGVVEGEKPASVTSLDELFRQRNEMDRNIAALRLEATQSQVLSGDNYSTIGEPAQSTIRQSSLTRSESFSGRSEFSLSVFPEPPAASSTDIATKYVVIDSPTSINQRNTYTMSLGPIAVTSEVVDSNGSAALRDIPQGGKDVSAGELDVTSFIGVATEASQKRERLGETENTILQSDDEQATTSAPTAVIASTNALRPMILTSTRLTSHSDSGGAIQINAIQASPLRADSPTSGLKPLLLGKPISSIPPMKTGTMVPLAQRRPRGRTITNGRRPLHISHPRMREEAFAGGIPSAYERPRPPPVRLH
ncbi:hypothetical protein CVT24_011543 [Panaeolus cyanescens]|uniref:Uncharacterized protein n=1 Tax=Panaeolus cyanescens TaxID=181874 RepID=A0A409VM73_9AGAR|nr:hypothetical protein CVT24_011543 [Panaeolus cyanescens]